MSLWRRYNYDLEGRVVEHLAEAPATTFWSKWFGGVVAPVLMTAYATWVLADQRATTGGPSDSIRLVGRVAVAYGLVWLFAGMFAHFHYFWTGRWRLAAPAVWGEGASLVGFIGALGYVIWVVVKA